MGPEVGRKMGMPVDKFTEIAYAKLVAGEEHVVIGTPGPQVTEDVFQDLVARRRKIADDLADLMLSHVKV